MTLRRALFAGIAAFALLTIGHLMMAQQGQGGAQFDPAQMQQMQLDRIKTQSGLADADWEGIKPKVVAVMEKRLPTLMGSRGSRSGGGGGGTGGGQTGGGGKKGGGGGGGGTSSMFGPQMEELTALRDALGADGASEADVKTKLDAFVAAYKKRQEELKTAQDALAAAAGDKVKLKAVLMIGGLIPVS